ncbi:MAG TPA: hypothetical protein ENJ37_02340 [Deltaproteobacteria bacterium]|nr:hypothetical protein [Deltaproteobacteria bacterium]
MSSRSRSSSRRFVAAAAALCAAALLLSAPGAADAGELVVVVDRSEPMGEPINGESRLDAAVEALGDFLGRNAGKFDGLALWSYGAGRCGSKPQRVTSRRRVLKALAALRPAFEGVAHTSDALVRAVKGLGPDDVVLVVSGGADGCSKKACAEVAGASERGKGPAVYAVALAVEDVRGLEELKCIASKTGGRFYHAHDVDELRRALGRIEKKVGYNLEIRVLREEGKEVTDYIRTRYAYQWGCRVYKSGTDEEVAVTNVFPARFHLPPGTYDVKVRFGTTEQWLRGVDVKEGERVKRTMNFARGSVVVNVFAGDDEVIGVKRIPKLLWWCDVFKAGTSEKVDGTVTFPVELDLVVGSYDIKVHYMGAEKVLEGVEVREGKTRKLKADFP